MPKDIYSQLKKDFDEIGYPNGMGYYIGDGTEDIFIVYLPYDDDVTGRAEDEITQLTNRLKIDIIARGGASFSEAEKKIKKTFKEKGYIYKNGEMDVDTQEPYNYHRILYYDINYYFDDLEDI